MKDGTTWAQRMRMVVERYGKPAELAAITGIAEERMAELCGGATPTFDELSQMVQGTDLDATWLLTGEGAALKGQAQAKRVMAIVQQLKAACKELDVHLNPQRMSEIAMTLLRRDEVLMFESLDRTH